MADEVTTPAVEPAPDAAPVVPDTTPAPSTAPLTTEADSVDKLPKWAQKLYEDLRKENARHRTEKVATEKASEEAARKAAEEQGQFKTLYETEKAAREAAERAKQDLALEVLRSKVGARHNLPVKLHDRIRGVTEEEMDADAKEILADLPRPAAITTNDASSGVNSSTPTQQKSDAELREEAARFGVGFEYLKQQYEKLRS